MRTIDAPRRTGRRVGLGVRFGLLLGALYSTLAAVILVARGGLAQGFGQFFRLWLATSSAYLVGWATGGGLIGLLLPLSGTIPGRMFIGMMATVPVAVSAALTLVILGIATADVDLLKVALLYAVIMGPIFGLLTWFAIGPNEKFD